MPADFEILLCGCGQHNRRPLNVERAGSFNCGKCGKPLLTVVSSGRAGKDRTEPHHGSLAKAAPYLILAGTIALLVFIAQSSPAPRPNNVAARAPPVVTTAPAALPVASAAPPPAVSPPAPAPLPAMASVPAQSLEIPVSSVFGTPAAQSKAPQSAPNTQQVPPGSASANLAAENLKIVPAPPTGDILARRRTSAIAPFAVETEPGPSYLLKLVNVSNPKDQIMVFVKGGETYSTKVPLGTYHLKAATGDVWYGRQHFFGPQTRFVRVRKKDRTDDDGVQAFKFSQSGNRISGLKISFKKVVGGNTSEESISREEFE
jgi:hypothetical protein